MERNQFTFYRSYYEAVRELPKKEQSAVMLAICAYALDEEEPNLTGTAKAIFSLVRPTLDASRRKAISGKSGGERKQTESKTEANDKQTAREKENKKENKNKKENECYKPQTPKRVVFVPPSLEDVTAYCKERGNSVDPQAFIDFYTSKGWMVGKNQMKDWKASVRTWEKGRAEKPKSVNNMAGVNFQPTAERIQKSSDWMDQFLAEQEGKHEDHGD